MRPTRTRPGASISHNGRSSVPMLVLSTSASAASDSSSATSTRPPRRYSTTVLPWQSSTVVLSRGVPRTVDADQRRRELAEAVWRVIRRDGVSGASVRTVAREAGTSMGALRHWFATQDELLHFAMTLVIERARARAEGLAATGGPLVPRLLRVLEETLPLDDERRAEAEGWLDRKSTRLNSSHANISYAVFCL